MIVLSEEKNNMKVQMSLEDFLILHVKVYDIAKYWYLNIFVILLIRIVKKYFAEFFFFCW